MPIYEYECKSCEKIHEAWQKITEDALTECPECGGELERLISATAFHLKGSGWYASDYKDAAPVRKEDSDAAAATSEKEGSGSGADDSGSSDAGWKEGYGPEGKKKEATADAKPASDKPKPKKDKLPAASSESKGESKSESKGASTTESKPAAKTKKPKS